MNKLAAIFGVTLGLAAGVTLATAGTNGSAFPFFAGTEYRIDDRH